MQNENDELKPTGTEDESGVQDDTLMGEDTKEDANVKNVLKGAEKAKSKKKTNSQKFKQTEVIETPVDEEDEEFTVDTPMPSSPDGEIYGNIAQALRGMGKAGADLAHWAEILEEGDLVSMFNSEETDIFAEGEWVQNVNGVKGMFRDYKKATGKISGDAAVTRFTTRVGNGRMFMVPLLGIGVWAWLRPATNNEIVDLKTKLDYTRKDLGSTTRGMIFSNITEITNKILVDFALDHVMNTNLKKGLVLEHSMLSTYDREILMWGTCASRFPNGFNTNRACTEDLATCNTVVDLKLDLHEMLWMHGDIVPGDIEEHFLSTMEKRSMTISRIEKYKDMLISKYPAGVFEKDIGDGITIELRIPTSLESEEAGVAWHTDLTVAADEAMAGSDSEAQREAILRRHLAASMCRTYSHFIKEIRWDGMALFKTDDITKALVSISSDSELSRKFISSVLAFVRETTIAKVAIPSFNCPTCSSEITAKGDDGEPVEILGSKHLIPIDMPTLFTNLISE